jgi:threonine aldolase
MSVIDMRSDTVTRPDAAMRQAMAAAEVGDDVLGDDPTIRRLQDKVAALLGKEAALFVPSGTMGNQLALKVHTRPGDQLILEDGAHIYRYEAGGPGALSGLLTTCIDAEGGQLSWEMISRYLNPADVHSAPPSLICVENTHNRKGGRILAQELVVEIGRQAHARGLKVHMDGARLWHTHVATGTPLAELCAPVDSVSVCFSKGLGAPVGSVLAGGADFIHQAHRYRKMWGGGMRQVGILGAACLHALEHNLQRLAEDHEHARLLSAGLDHPALSVNHPVDTNIVILDVAGPEGDRKLLQHLAAEGILAVGFGPGRVRLIPNLDTDRQAVLRVKEALNAFTGD